MNKFDVKNVSVVFYDKLKQDFILLTLALGNKFKQEKRLNLNENSTDYDLIKELITATEKGSQKQVLNNENLGFTKSVINEIVKGSSLEFVEQINGEITARLSTKVYDQEVAQTFKSGAKLNKIIEPAVETIGFKLRDLEVEHEYNDNFM